MRVTNNDLNALPSGYCVGFSFDHSELVLEGKSLISGNDLRVVYYDGVNM